MNWTLDDITLHCGTNHFLRKNYITIAESYITLTKKAKAETSLVSVSQNIPSNLQDTEVNNSF